MKKTLLLTFISLSYVYTIAQNVGIGTTNPLARLHVADSAVLFSGSTNIPPNFTTINPPMQGAGTRMLWFPALGALRTGYVDGVQWNRDSIGLLSFAAGINTKATKEFSTSFGSSTTASNSVATSMGFGTIARGQVSTSMGNGSIASGFTSTSMGLGTLASGDYSTAMGQSNTAMGIGATATGGSTAANGNYSFSGGEQTFAKARGSFTVGLWNDIVDIPNPNTTSLNDRIFQIGNGTSSVRSNALTVLRNGNVGIGIIDPLFKLDMRGRILLRGDGNISNAPGVTFTNINGDLYKGLVGMQSDSVIGFLASGINGAFWGLNMNVDHGRIGIGTTNPRAQLHITGPVSRALPPLWINASDDFNRTVLKMSNPAVAGYSWKISSIIDPNANSFNNMFSIFREVDSAIGLIIPSIAINRDGYVGIGTFGPIAPLSFPPFLGKKISLYPGNTGDAGIAVQGNLLQMYADNPNADIAFGYDQASVFTERMRIKGNGNVGIGTTTPDFPISFPNTLGDKISLWGSSGPHYGFGVQGSAMQIHSATTLDDIAFGYGSSSSLTERARIINNGEFGMSLTGRLQLKTGTQSAGLWFTNNANTTNTAFAGMRSDTEVGFFGQTGTAGWRFYVNTTSGNAWLQGTLTQNSDASLKTNITSIYNALPQLMKLSGYRYNWKDSHADPEKQIGLLAQEVQAVFPELVKENSNGKLGVNYNGMIPVLLEGIKEQQKQIEKQQKEIDNLKECLYSLLNKNK